MPAPPGGGGAAWPNESNTGAPANITALSTCSGTINTTSDGQVIQDICIDGDILVGNDNVVIRRVDIRGGRIVNWKFNDAGCGANLLVQDTTIRKTAPINVGEESAIELGSYTAERVKVLDLAEGYRSAGADHGCTTVTVKDSFLRIHSPDSCPNYDWHGDGLQGNGGPPVTIRNSTFDMVYLPNTQCGGTGPFFYSSQGNTSADIDGMLLIGGGYSMRLGEPATVRNVYIKDKGNPAIRPDGTGDGYFYGSIDVKCSQVSVWQNVNIASVDAIMCRLLSARSRATRRAATSALKRL